MKRLAIVTATRAEYGLLKPIIMRLKKETKIDIKLIATGMHLSPEFGKTVDEIKSDGIVVDKEIEILLSADTPTSISKSMGLALIGFSDYFAEIKPDGLIVLGDRYETLAVAIAALNARIPIIHLYGGEATEGMIDEAVRNAITKLSYLHFTSTKEYRQRVIQMGEDPERVFEVGAMGVENACKMDLMSKNELEDSIGYKLGDNYAILTFHPVTLENNTASKQIDDLLLVMEKHTEINFLCTKANADTNGRIINEKIAEYCKLHDNAVLVDSLGAKRYLSAIKYASFVIGNSSSGLIEVPSFHIPTINIGDRQKGRIQGKSIISCEPEQKGIEMAIGKAMDSGFRSSILKEENPYGDGKTSEKIVKTILDYVINNKLRVEKHFYTIENL